MDISVVIPCFARRKTGGAARLGLALEAFTRQAHDGFDKEAVDPGPREDADLLRVGQVPHRRVRAPGGAEAGKQRNPLDAGPRAADGGLWSREGDQERTQQSLLRRRRPIVISLFAQGSE